MTLKIGYAYEQVDAHTLSDGSNEREVTGVSKLELARILGNYFLNDLCKVQNQALTLNIAICEETPDNVVFITDLLFKGITNQQSCVTKINVKPQTLFTPEQFKQINQQLIANHAALKVVLKNKNDDANKTDAITAAQPPAKPNASSNRVWLSALLAAGLSFVAILSFSSLLSALLISTSIGLVVGYFLNKPIQENVTLEPKKPTAEISHLYNQEEQHALAQCKLAHLVSYELSRISTPSTEFSEHYGTEALVGLIRCK